MSQFWKDALERIGWTVAQVVLGLLIVTLTDADLWWAALVIPVLTSLKVLVAKRVGNPESAAIGGNG